MNDMRKSFAKAFLAGVAGGLVGSAAKVIAEKLVPPRTEGQQPPPKVVVDKAQNVAGASLPPAAKKAAAEGIHWTFGTLTGGVYGLAAELRPGVTAWKGAAFGLGVNKLMHRNVLPKTGLAEAPGDQPAQEQVSEWITHVVYGVTTELVRSYVRKRL